MDPGPGLRNAHRRILAADPGLDPAILPPSDTEVRSHPTPAQLPAAPAVFVGRKEQRAEVLGALRTPVLVHGPAGVGKTSFALHVAHLFAPRFPDGQLFVDLRGFGPSGTIRDYAGVLA